MEEEYREIQFDTELSSVSASYELYVPSSPSIIPIQEDEE